MRPRWFFYLLLSVLFHQTAMAQCDLVTLPPGVLQVLSTDSEDFKNPATNVVDGDLSSYWATRGTAPFPHQISLDLGQTYAVSQVQLSPHPDLAIGRPFDFELLLSDDGSTWLSVAKGSLPYLGESDYDTKNINFGATDARYLRLLAHSNAATDPVDYRLVIGELQVAHNPCGSEGKQAQFIEFPHIAKRWSTDSPFDPGASSSAGLPVSYEVFAGDANVDAGKISLGGSETTILVRAFHPGDDNYSPAENFRVFQVINPDLYEPRLTSRLSDVYPLEMENLTGYPLYADIEIEHADALGVTEVYFEVNNQRFPGTLERGAYVYWWLPQYYGDHDIRIVAEMANGKTVEKRRTVRVTKADDGQRILALDEVLIDFAINVRSQVQTVELPQFVGSYDILSGSFWVECPDVAGGCDDWDRLAYVQVKAPNGEWVEIIRYITPYGIGCFHNVNLTDYASLLQGEVELRVFIDTWGTGGWNVNLELNYERGIPQYLYSQVDPLWEGTYPFGDPFNLQPMDTLQYQFPETAEQAKLVLTTTGHGWGSNNSLNAAEFFRATHHIHVDGSSTFAQDLWVDCTPNPDACNGQLGNWESNRAGWCPGIIAPNYEYQLDPYLDRNSIQLAYIFHEDYMDLCHRNNPDCVNGVICDNCNDGFNPNYRIRGQVITYSNTSLATSTRDLETARNAELFPNPSAGTWQIRGGDFGKDILLELRSVDGRLIDQQSLSDADALEAKVFDYRYLPNGSYWVKITSERGTQSLSWIKQ
ncbi:MAG: discoidin domain-containing protein [Bacteroidota bacterium]